MLAEEKIGQDKISQGLLAALASDEQVLQEKYAAYRTAWQGYDVAARRFAAMREAARERLGVSPFAKNVEWPLGFDMTGEVVTERPSDTFRFVRMKIGDAVVETLQESEEPLSLADIVRSLQAGGLTIRDARTVNAALINTKGIAKLEDGRYTYEEEGDLEW